MNKTTASRQDELEHRLARLRCPDCRGELRADGGLVCRSCGRQFCDERTGLMDLTPRRASETKEKIATFWGDTYQQWYEKDDAARTTESLKKELVLLEDLFRRRRHLAVTEMELNRLSDKEVLEIGSGGGGHSALFMAHGARVTSVDITPERVMSTNLKMDLLRGNAPGSGLALCADAVVLPFAENAFDIAYSNGVLHHTANTDRTIEEVYRVVKPGGRAVIMLYARSSALYWTNLLIRGILNGEAFRLPESEWLGHITEGAPKYRREQNPITRVYNRRELLKLFSRFENVSLRKSSFDLSQLLMPRGGIVRERLLCALGHPPHEGGRIVYGSPYTPEIGWELALGHLIGFTWNVKAAKPVDTR